MYTYSERIRYSETDNHMKLTISGLVNFFQDAAIFEAEAGKIDMKYLGEHHLGWLLGSWQIVMERMPRLSEKVIITTIPYCFKGFLGYRNFIMTTEDGEVLAKASSIWSLVDTKRMRPSKPTEEILAGYTMGDKLDMEYKPRKIALEGEREQETPFYVRKSQIDSVQHVNNAEYVNMALDYLEADRRVREIRVEYKNAAYVHDMIIPYVSRQQDRTQVVLQGQENVIYAIIEATYE